MNSFQFRCIGCGKCCNSTPVLALSEIPNFVDKFVIMIRVMVVYVRFSEAAGSLAGRQVENFSKLGGMPFSNAYGRGVIRAVGHPLDHNFDGMCPMLQEDGLCSIYETRPNICRTVPFDTVLPEADQDHVIEGMIAHVSKGIFPCQIDGDAPVVYENRTFTPTDYRKNFQAGVLLNSNQVMQDRLLKPVYYNSNAIDRLLEEANGGHIPRLHLFHYMEIFPELFDNPGAVIDSQLRLIQRVIDENIRQRKATDKPLTANFRSLQQSLLNYQQQKSKEAASTVV